MYEDILMHSFKTHYTVLVQDFNTKLGTRENGELKVGKFGIGQRNPRDQLLADFMEKEGLFLPEAAPQEVDLVEPRRFDKNEIDFIMMTRRHLLSEPRRLQCSGRYE